MQVGSSSRLLTICLVTCIDGYEMAKQGRDGKALGIAAIGSFRRWELDDTRIVLALTVLG